MSFLALLTATTEYPPAHLAPTDSNSGPEWADITLCEERLIQKDLAERTKLLVVSMVTILLAPVRTVTGQVKF
jgi:hypothetical protein